MQYQVEQRIHTLAQNVVDSQTSGAPEFTEEGVTFKPWDDWWTQPYWLARSVVEARDFKAAWQAFNKIIMKLVPRISVVSQCYTENRTEPFLILRKDSGVAFVRWVEERGSVGLMFMDDEQEALKLLIKSHAVPDEFYYYWNDATNSSGYASRLLLMFSAVECLLKEPPGMSKDERMSKLESILGAGLKKALWGVKGDSSDALRHRLVHGEYFEPNDGQIDYFQALHRKVISYLNESILKKPLLSESVTGPQRHPFGNKTQGHSWIRSVGNSKLNLINIVTDMEKTGSYNLTNYERIVDDSLWTTY